MTTIAYRDGIMAADSGSWFSSMVFRSAQKLARGSDGSLHGVAGNAGDAGQYLRWVLEGMTGEAPQPEAVDREEGRGAFVALVIPPTGETVRLWTAFGWEDHHDMPFIAIGAGAEIAIGAMAAGATAEQAVAFTAEYSGYAALPVRSIARAGAL